MEQPKSMMRGGGVGGGDEADDFAVVVGQEVFDLDAAEFVEAVDGLLEQINSGTTRRR